MSLSVTNGGLPPPLTVMVNRIRCLHSLLALLLLTIACGAASEVSTDGGVLSADVDPRTDNQFTEYGGGQFGIFLSSEPEGTYCLIRETTRRGCRGWSSPRTSVRWICHDNATDCDAFLLPDSEEETSDCFKNVDYQVETFGELYGTCDHFERYDRGDTSVQCLVHEDCPTGRLCTDYQCLCPPGADCACLGGVPATTGSCEGDELVSMSQGPGCDENGYAYSVENRIDCAAQGGQCDPSMSACVGTGTDGGVGADGGTTSPDTGPAPVDAGCMCPPTPPSRCEGGAVVRTTCDPSDCSLIQQATTCGQGCENGRCL